MRTVHFLSTGMVLLALAGCGWGERADATGPTIPPPMPRLPAAPVAGVAEADGRTLIELPLGSEDGIEAGQFIRVRDPHDAERIKATALVREVAGPHRSIARLLGLADRAAPVRPGDPAQVVVDVVAQGSAQAVEESARRTVAGQEAADGKDEERYLELRRRFQAELVATAARNAAALAQLRQEHDKELASREELHLRKLVAKDEERRGDLAAAKAAAAEQVAAAIAADRKAQEDRLNGLLAERTRLQTELDRLLPEQEDAQRRLAAAIADQGVKEQGFRRRLAAEIEAREALQARLAELEQRLTGSLSALSSVLSRDPQRSEGILARITRLEAELAIERDRAARAESALEEARRLHLAAQRELADTRAALAAAEERAGGGGKDQLERLAAEAERSRRALAEAAERRSAAELARLEAERTLYDLASRILRLGGKDPELAALQERLRRLLAAAEPPESKP